MKNWSSGTLWLIIERWNAANWQKFFAEIPIGRKIQQTELPTYSVKKWISYAIQQSLGNLFC